MENLERSNLVLDSQDKDKLKAICKKEGISISEITRLLHKAIIQGKIKISKLKIEM